MQWITDAFTWASANQAVLLPFAVLILTSICNGLAKYPTEQNIVRFIIDRISFHTNSDSPGTFKVPLVMGSKPPITCEHGQDFTPVPSSKNPVRGSASPALLGFFAFSILVIGIILATFTVSCAALGPVPQQLLDCESADVQNQLPGLVTQVTSKLSTGTWNAQAGLDELLGSQGPAVVCAVEAVISDLVGSAPAGGSLGAADEAELVAAQSWLASEGHAKLVKGSSAMGYQAGSSHIGHSR